MHEILDMTEYIRALREWPCSDAQVHIILQSRFPMVLHTLRYAILVLANTRRANLGRRIGSEKPIKSWPFWSGAPAARVELST